MFEFLAWVAGLLLSLSGVTGMFDTATAPPSSTTEDVAEQVPTYPETIDARVVQVIDGDTIDVEIDSVVERVRYIGIDSPEYYESGNAECFADEATAANRALVEGKTVRLVPDEELRDDYDRLLRYVFVDDTFVNRELIEDGYATLLFIPPNTEHYGDFLDIRDTARAEGRGLWSACESAEI